MAHGVFQPSTSTCSNTDLQVTLDPCSPSIGTIVESAMTSTEVHHAPRYSSLSQEDLKAYLLGCAGPLLCARAVKQYGSPCLRRLSTSEICVLFMELANDGLGNLFAVKNNMWFAKVDPNSDADILKTCPLLSTAMLSSVMYCERFCTADRFVPKMSPVAAELLVTTVEEQLGQEYATTVKAILQLPQL